MKHMHNANFKELYEKSKDGDVICVYCKNGKQQTISESNWEKEFDKQFPLLADEPDCSADDAKPAVKDFIRQEKQKSFEEGREEAFIDFGRAIDYLTQLDPNSKPSEVLKKLQSLLKQK